MTAIQIIDKRLIESIKLFDIRYVRVSGHPDVEKDNLNEAILSAMKEYAKIKCEEQRKLCADLYKEFGEGETIVNPELFFAHAHKPDFD